MILILNMQKLSSNNIFNSQIGSWFIYKNSFSLSNVDRELKKLVNNFVCEKKVEIVDMHLNIKTQK